MERLFGRGTTAIQSATCVVAAASILVLIGILTIEAVSATGELQKGVRPWYAPAGRQAVFALIALLGGLVTAKIDYRTLVERSFLFLVMTWIGLVFVLAFAEPQLGARRWIDLGPFSVQVSEFAKLVVILCCARWVVARADCIDSYTSGFLPVAGWLGLTFVLIALEPDFGTSLFILATALALLNLGGLRLRHIATAGLFLAPFCFFMASQFDHIKRRLSWFRGDGLEHVNAAVVALGSGGVFGAGIGDGRAHLGFLPMVRNDFIFAAIGEQWGFAGSIAVILLYLTILWHGVKIAVRAPDTEGAIVAFGVTFMIVFQAGINMGVVMGILPPKGISLPFVSHGGSSLAVLGLSLGVLVSVAHAATAGRAEESRRVGDGVLEP